MTFATTVVIGNLPHRTPVWVDAVYLAAAVAFIVALKGLSSPKQARNGNLLAAAAAIVAVAVTFFNPVAQFSSHTTNLILALVAMVLGAVIAVPVARMVKMTAMPQLVAIFNGVGGGAAALISIVVFLGDANLHSLGLDKPPVYAVTEGMLGLLIGCVSFSGAPSPSSNSRSSSPGARSPIPVNRSSTVSSGSVSSSSPSRRS